MKTIEVQLNDARRLLNAAITEYEGRAYENAVRGIEEVRARLAAVAHLLRDAIRQEKEPETQLVYHEPVGIVSVPMADKWEARETALLVRPQGHCVSITSPSGERWSV